MNRNTIIRLSIQMMMLCAIVSVFNARASRKDGVDEQEFHKMPGRFTKCKESYQRYVKNQKQEMPFGYFGSWDKSCPTVVVFAMPKRHDLFSVMYTLLADLVINSSPNLKIALNESISEMPILRCVTGEDVVHGVIDAISYATGSSRPDILTVGYIFVRSMLARRAEIAGRDFVKKWIPNKEKWISMVAGPVLRQTARAILDATAGYCVDQAAQKVNKWGENWYSEEHDSSKKRNRNNDEDVVVIEEQNEEEGSDEL